MLYPFVPPDEIDEAVLERLAGAVAAVPTASVRFERVGWFEDRVLWLAPDPAQPFRALTDAVRAAFPEQVPYAGLYRDVVPHLTVGDTSRGGVRAEQLRDAEDAVQATLPVSHELVSAEILVGTAQSGTWRSLARLPLREAPAPTT